MLTVFRTCFKTRKSRDGANTTLTTHFLLSRRKKMPMLLTTEITIFIRMTGRVFIQQKQPNLWLIANINRNMLWGHNADNYFLNLSWNIHTYHLHSTTSTTSSYVENENYDVTVYNSNNHGHNIDNYFLNLLSWNIHTYDLQTTTWTISL